MICDILLPIILLQTNISAVEVMELVSDLRDTVGSATEEGVGQNNNTLRVVDEALETVRRFLVEDEGFTEPGADEQVCCPSDNVHNGKLFFILLMSIYVHADHRASGRHTGWYIRVA